MLSIRSAISSCCRSASKLTTKLALFDQGGATTKQSSVEVGYAQLT